jgi:FAD/FMN-containing dehydrogenase
VLFGELRHLGGAVGRVPEGAGAVGRLHGEYLTFGAGLVLDAAGARAVTDALGGFRAATAAYETGKAYLNFAERPTDAAKFYGDDAYARLRAIRAAVDPDGRMVGNHPIPAS